MSSSDGPGEYGLVFLLVEIVEDWGVSFHEIWVEVFLEEVGILHGENFPISEGFDGEVRVDLDFEHAVHEGGIPEVVEECPRAVYPG